MDDLYLDLETFGTVPLRSHGSHRYAQEAEVMLVGMAWDDAPASVVDYTDPERRPDQLRELQYAIKHARTVVTHGSFDRIMLATMREGPVIVPVEKQDDTMLTALQHSLPGGLGKLCTILNVPFDEAKDVHNKRLINLFCSPTPSKWKIRRATKESHPTEWDLFLEYNRLDITSMRHVRKLLPRWNCTALERQYWYHDQTINGRGMRVDLDHARAAIIAYDRVKHEAKGEAHALTGGLLGSVSQRETLLQILRSEYGWQGDLTKATLERVMRGDIDPELRKLLELRLKASAASPAKYNALLKATCHDGRLRDTLQFCGAARTGRDCLAEGTLVLVKDNLGVVLEVPIEQVRDDDLVWDGEEWVAHEGVVFSGDKDVVEHDGVVATTEHIVYISTTESVTLGEAKAKGLKLWRGSPYTN